MKRGGPLSRYTRLAARSGLRCGPWRRGQSDPALPKHGPSRALNPIPLSARRAVAERSSGICEFCDAAFAAHLHHRKLRSQGGDNSPANLIHLCAADHDWAHRHPRLAVEVGLIVPRHADPETTPVRPLGVTR